MHVHAGALGHELDAYSIACFRRASPLLQMIRRALFGIEEGLNAAQPCLMPASDSLCMNSPASLGEVYLRTAGNRAYRRSYSSCPSYTLSYNLNYQMSRTCLSTPVERATYARFQVRRVSPCTNAVVPRTLADCTQAQQESFFTRDYD